MINVDDILVRWVPYIIGARDAIVVQQFSLCELHGFPGRVMRFDDAIFPA
jgi:hypothetical protein